MPQSNNNSLVGPIEIMLLIGLVLLGVGCGMVSVPLGLIVPGAVLVVFALVALVSRGKV